MKNIRFTAVLLALLMMTGCSADKNSGEAPAQEFAAQTEYVMQDGDTQITGEVTSIVGNEVTLALGEITENEKGNRGGEKPADGEMPEMQERAEVPEGDFEKGEMPEMPEGAEIPEGDFEKGEMPEMPEGAEIPEGDFGNGEMPERMENSKGDYGNGEVQEGLGGENTKGSKGGSATIEKNGETAAYTIPVGMTISGTGGRNSDYSAISAGMVLRLTLNSDGYVVAAEII